MEIAEKTTMPAEGAETAVNAANSTGGEIILSKDENANTGASSTYTHTFKKPFSYQGKTYSEVNFCFGRLTGESILEIEAEMQANNDYAIDPLLSRNFLSKMASKASGIPSDVLEAMSARDFVQITNAARNFLIDSGY